MSGERLKRVQTIASACMDEVLAQFKSGAKITLIVRTPALPDADFLMTSDDLDEVLSLIQRRQKASSDV